MNNPPWGYSFPTFFRAVGIPNAFFHWKTTEYRYLPLINKFYLPGLIRNSSDSANQGHVMTSSLRYDWQTSGGVITVHSAHSGMRSLYQWVSYTPMCRWPLVVLEQKRSLPEVWIKTKQQCGRVRFRRSMRRPAVATSVHDKKEIKNGQKIYKIVKHIARLTTPWSPDPRFSTANVNLFKPSSRPLAHTLWQTFLKQCERDDEVVVVAAATTTIAKVKPPQQPAASSHRTDQSYKRKQARTAFRATPLPSHTLTNPHTRSHGLTAAESGVTRQDSSHTRIFALGVADLVGAAGSGLVCWELQENENKIYRS